MHGAVNHSATAIVLLEWCCFYCPRAYVRQEVMFSQVCVCSTFRGGYPIQPWTGGGTQSSLGGGVPQPWSGGYPNLGQGEYPIPSPEGYPPARNSKHLLRLRGGRCASCVHAGGLSCWLLFCAFKVDCWDQRVAILHSVSDGILQVFMFVHQIYFGDLDFSNTFTLCLDLYSIAY